MIQRLRQMDATGADHRAHGLGQCRPGGQRHEARRVGLHRETVAQRCAAGESALADAARRSRSVRRSASRNSSAMMRTQLQTRIVPQRHLVREGIEIFGDSIPADVVGGDYFGVWQPTADALHFCVADVSGKGTPGAMIAAMLYASVSTLSSSSNSPELILGAGGDDPAQPAGRRTLRHHLLRCARSQDPCSAVRERRTLPADPAAWRRIHRIAGAHASGSGARAGRELSPGAAGAWRAAIVCCSIPTA